jgi:hypothetical protein
MGRFPSILLVPVRLYWRVQIIHSAIFAFCLVYLGLFSQIATTRAFANQVVVWGNPTNLPANSGNIVAIRMGEVSGANGLSNVIAVAAGPYRSVLLRSDGTMFACGSIDLPPAGFTNIVAVSTGAGHTVAITIPLQIASITLTNQHPLLRFQTFSGQQYSVEYSPDFNSGIWSGLPGGNVVGNGSDALVTDPQTTAVSPSRYYRLKQ